ncbi:MAG: hypothetical protein DRP08_02505 [Candidatus Aenigmatarchaeota archaeon]|nr:MAG: hypothetical protein DRP08_02505 [Candidatus Aenigmarchaeota archaeon]
MGLRTETSIKLYQDFLIMALRVMDWLPMAEELLQSKLNTVKHILIQMLESIGFCLKKEDTKSLF